MKSLREVAQIQGVTDSSISVVQLAGKLDIQIPFSVQHRTRNSPDYNSFAMKEFSL